MTELVRADALRNYPGLVAELGGDATALLREFKIPREAISARDEYISFRAMIALLESSADRLGCKDFGLRMGRQQDFDMYGPVALAAQNCETLGDAIACVSRYFHTHNPATLIALEPQNGRRVRLCVRLALPNPPAHRQVEERNAVLAYQALQLLSSETCQPLNVWLPHPALSALSRYHGSFPNCAVRFDGDCVAIDFKAADLHNPIRGNNAQLRRVAMAYLESQHRQTTHATLRVRVREAIKPLLSSGRCNQTNLADALHLHPRTLQRRLAEEATSFEALKDEVRREVAAHYLKDSVLPLSHVAALLGYSEQSALTRSCQRWFQLAPLALRRNPRYTAARAG